MHEKGQVVNYLPLFFCRHTLSLVQIMNMKHISLLGLSICFFALQHTVSAQSTFTEVYNTLQIKCSGCHGGASPQGNLDLSGSESDVYNALYEVAPTNPAAAATGDKLVDPGYPYRSYLLEKVAQSSWDDSFQLDPAEGNLMPTQGAPMTDVETELLRQWIIAGAPQSGQVIDPMILDEYYVQGNALSGISAPPAPAQGEGYQIRLGPIFLEPQEEIEFFTKYDPRVTEDYEVNRLKVEFDDESHHFILFKMDAQDANSYPEGIRDVNVGQAFDLQQEILGTWQDNGDFDLPEGTAYFWNQGDNLDFNYHLKNYSTNGILASNVYLNVYTQPQGTAEKKMWSMLLPIGLLDSFLGGGIGDDLVIPSDGNEHTFTDPIIVPDLPFIPFPTGEWHIWQLSSHTHQTGTDFDIFLRNSDGSKGQQIYEGFYNTNYQFNQGYYDWEHPAIRYFDPLLPVDMSQGLIQEATYINNTGNTLEWGYTTDDEMLLTVVQFTDGPLSTSVGTQDLGTLDVDVSIRPNPFAGRTNIQYELTESGDVTVEIINAIGQRVAILVDEYQNTGVQQIAFETHAHNVSNGMYYLTIRQNGLSTVRKLIVAE